MSDQGIHLGLMELSAIREMANIGLGHATTALAEMTGRPFNMSIPRAESVALHAVPSLVGSPEALAVGIYMRVDGDICGHMAFLFPWESACSLWAMVLGAAPASPEAVTELEASALVEIGNIINSSFLNAISDMTGCSLHATPPALSIEMSAAILESILSEASLTDSVALTINTEIFDAAQSASGHFLYLPTRGGLRSLFRALGIAEAA